MKCAPRAKLCPSLMLPRSETCPEDASVEILWGVERLTSMQEDSILHAFLAEQRAGRRCKRPIPITDHNDAVLSIDKLQDLVAERVDRA